MKNTVRTMTVAGCQRELICRCVINPDTGKPITLKTLLKYFKDELEVGDAKANAQVVAALYRTAIGPPSGPQVAAAIFWTKTKMGWRDAENRGLIDALANLKVSVKENF